MVSSTKIDEVLRYLVRKQEQGQHYDNYLMEISRNCGFETRTVQRCLKELEKWGAADKKTTDRGKKVYTVVEPLADNLVQIEDEEKAWNQLKS